MVWLDGFKNRVIAGAWSFEAFGFDVLVILEDIYWGWRRNNPLLVCSYHFLSDRRCNYCSNNREYKNIKLVMRSEKKRNWNMFPFNVMFRIFMCQRYAILHMLLEDMLNVFVGKCFCLLNSFALIKCHLLHREK